MTSLFEIEDFMLDLSGLYANREAENQLEEERLKEAKNQLQAERERDRLQKWRLEAARLDPQDQMQAGPNWIIWKEWSSGKYENFYEELKENKLRKAENQLEEERLKEAKNQLQAESGAPGNMRIRSGSSKHLEGLTSDLSTISNNNGIKQKSEG